MATPKKDNDKPVETGEKRVLVHLPRAPQGETQQEWVAVNGQSMIIQRGVDVEVPERFAAALRDSDRAAELTDRFVEENSYNG